MAPHRFPIVPELGDAAEGALRDQAAVVELGDSALSTRPDALVLAGNLGVRVESTIC